MNFKSLYVWFALPVAVIAAWFFLVYMPMESGVKSREGKLNAIKNERQTVEREMKDFVLEATAQKRLKESYDEFMGQAPPLERVPDYVKTVMNMAKNRGMVVTDVGSRVSSIDVSRKAAVVNPIFEFDLAGGFLDMGRFLEDLSNRTAFKGVQAARIDYDEKEYPRLAGKFIIEFKALKGEKSEGK